MMNMDMLKPQNEEARKIINGWNIRVVSKQSCTLDLFFGVDYHSHLGTKRGGMAIRGNRGFTRSIHNIENTPFRTKFDGDLRRSWRAIWASFCISDNEPPAPVDPVPSGKLRRHHHGGEKINNMDELVAEAYENGHIHFMEMSHGRINATELVAAIINQKPTLVEGFCTGEKIRGSMSILILTPEGIASGPLRENADCNRKKDNAHCVTG